MARPEALSKGSIARFAALADRCHVGRTNLEVARFAFGRIRPGIWRQYTRASRKRALRALFVRHRNNAVVYIAVMRGV